MMFQIAYICITLNCLHCLPLDERTCSKFFFYAGNDYQEAGGLPDYIPDESLPDFLGGSSTVSEA